MKNILKEFVKSFKVSKKEYILKLITSLFIRGVLLLIPVLFSMAINYATKGEYNNAMIYILLSICITILYRLIEGINQKTFYNLYNKLFSYYNSLGIDKTDENSIFSLSRFNLGQYSNMLITDVDIISSFFSNGVIRVVQLLEFIVIYIYFWSLDFVLFISAVILSIVVLIIIPKVNAKVEKLNSIKKNDFDKMTASIHEYYNNIKEIKCFNIFDKIAPITKKQSEKYLNSNANYIVKYYWNNQFFLLAIEIFRLLAVGYGIYLITQGNLEIGALLIIYNYYQKIIDNFSTILTINVEYTNLKVSFERFNHLIEYSHSKENKEITEQHITEGKIQFKDILYGYRNNPLLQHLSFTIEPNSLTAITGKAGSGKTGIFELLLKLNRQHDGEILIDGVNIKDIPNDEYFSNIVLLRKNPSLFTMSIKENFLLIENNEEKVYEVCKKLGIHKQIEALPNGYDTNLSENDGVAASLKQLIAIGRIILKDTKIMLFDEALVGLDENEQDKVLRLLLEIKDNHTIVMISRDNNVLKDAEKIIVLDSKKVVETGTLEELLGKEGKFYKLFCKKEEK